MSDLGERLRARGKRLTSQRERVLAAVGRLGHATPALVGGAIAMWGDVELHPTGLRSQYACVVALVLPWIGTRKRRRVTLVGELLEVEIVPLHALTVAAERYGKPVSDALVPQG